MRNFFYFFIFISSFANAADGDTLSRQVKRHFVTNSFGHKKWGLYRVPDATATKYPVIVFMHGIGEAGSTEADVPKLLKYGTPWLISSGANLDFTNPITGLPGRFISLAIQNATWSAEITDVIYVLENDPLLKNRVDWNGVFITGLSSGGQNTMNAVLTSPEISAKVCGIVPMSSAGANMANISLAVQERVWAFHGRDDMTCPYQVTEAFCAAIPGSKWTELPGIHGNWNTYYSSNYRENIGGYQMNIYEWMLTKMCYSVLSINQAPNNSPAPAVPKFTFTNDGIRVQSGRYSAFYIIDGTGRVVMSGNVKVGVNHINTRMLSSGAYYFLTYFTTHSFVKL